jgi:hypothetical protein
LALISCELLQSADASAGANDGDQIVWLHLLVQKLLQRLAHVIGTFKRKTQVVYNESNRPTHLIWSYSNRRCGRSIPVRWRRRFRHDRRVERDVGEVSNLLWLAVFQYLNFLRP